MKRLATMAVLTVAFCGGLSGAKADHSNELKYDAFAVQNQTRTTMTYQVTWGRETRSVTLAPGQEFNHVRLLSSGPAPAPVVRFTSGGATRGYRVETNASDTPQGGLVYQLRVRPDGNVALIRMSP